MARRKKTSDQVSQPALQALARLIEAEQAGLLLSGKSKEQTQDEIARWLGTSQPTVSRILGTIAVKPRPYRSLGRKLFEQLAERFDETYESLSATGIKNAHQQSTEDMIKHRGEALLFLAGPDFPPDLVAALRRYPVPDGASGWTRARWANHLLWLKKSWEDGHIELPGVRRS